MLLLLTSCSFLIILHCSLTVAESDEDVTRLAFCHMMTRCPTATETLLFSTYYRVANRRKNELVRELALWPEFEERFIKNNGDPIETLFLLILERLPNSKRQIQWQIDYQLHGYRYVVNKLIDSPEYRQKYGKSSMPGYGKYNCCHVRDVPNYYD